MKKRLSIIGIIVIIMGILTAGVMAEEKNPVVKTLETDSITSNTAIFRGVYEGSNEKVTERGFMYRLGEINDQDYKKVIVPGDNTVPKFGYTVPILIPETTYAVKAYVKTSDKLIEGEEVTFKTLPAPVTEIEATPDTGMVEDALSASMPIFLMLCLFLSITVLIRNKRLD